MTRCRRSGLRPRRRPRRLMRRRGHGSGVWMPRQGKPGASPMFVAPEWIEAHCVIPDGDDRGSAFRLGDEQARFVIGHYRVQANAVAEMRAPAFVFRRSQLVRAQKWGKSPLIAA